MLEFFIKGGWLMIPLGICSILALAIIIERFISLKMIESKSERFAEKTRSVVNSSENRKVDKIFALCEMTPISLARILKAGLEKRVKGKEEIKEAIQDVGSEEIPYLEKRLKILGTITAIAPLIGLLGTVVGMIRAFNVITVQGIGDPGALAGGIAVALYTTAFGLGIAIPSLVFYNYFMHRTDKIIRRLESISREFIEFLSGE
ncbi:MotA/TolQ/ExbB proton channel family protein [Patescibacteria group bacterium]|nr:MotA/TolQ/ExbB proton channel family protein [Patescibacteria group bacterium]